MELPPDWNGHPKLIYSFGWRFDPELPFIVERLPKGSVALDIGANLGTWSLVLSKSVGDTGKIVSFEPTLRSCQVLQNSGHANVWAIHPNGVNFLSS
ncbi:MAG: hypothetical protein JWP08_1618 [Bryobacterales bacterium]|nr:hypothetical protein [Bryobacterales bacterium]